MNKGISPVVATALLLVVAVVGVIGFQLWNESFQSEQTTLANQEAATLPYTFKIDSIKGELMYVYSDRNQTFGNVSIAGVACNITTNLTPGLNRLNISSCVQSGIINEVVYVLNEREFGARSVYPKDSVGLSVSVGSITINVTYWTNITDTSIGAERIDAVAVDSNDNVYVSGSCTSCGNMGNTAYYTMSFDSNGNHRWTNITDPSTSIDSIRGAAVDSSDNVYIVGYCDGCGTVGSYAFHTMSFDSDGNHRWTNITDPTANLEYALGIAVDSNDDVYVAGYCNGCGSTGANAMYLVKYDSNGNHQWTNVTDPTAANDVLYAVATDSSNNVYVTGECNGCGDMGIQAIYTIKFNSAGVHQWTNITDPTGGSDSGTAIDTDSNNNVYIGGSCSGCGSQGLGAMYTFSLTASGNYRWTNITDPTTSSEYVSDIVVDNNDDVYTTGSCNGCGSQGALAFYTMKFNETGTHQWTNITDPTSSHDSAHRIDVDSNNDVYIGGYCTGCGSVGGAAFYTFKLNGVNGTQS